MSIEIEHIYSEWNDVLIKVIASRLRSEDVAQFRAVLAKAWDEGYAARELAIVDSSSRGMTANPYREETE